MRLSSFLFTFAASAGLDTRDSVIIDCDFSTLFPDPDSKVVLLYASLSGMRQNVGGIMNSPGEFAARLLGNFNANNDPVYSVNVPRVGDLVNPFDGLTFSSSQPFIPTENTSIFMPVNFQIEFLPSNAKGNTPNDILDMFVTIGFRQV